MSDEKKPSDSENPAVDGFFDSLIGDFELEKSGSAPEIPKLNEDERPRGMRDFSKFFDDATAFGGGFESTIDKPTEELAAKGEEETFIFAGNSSADKKIITTPVTDENGMIVIYDEEAGIDATEADISSVVYSAAKKEKEPEKDITLTKDSSTIIKKKKREHAFFRKFSRKKSRTREGAGYAGRRN